MATKRVVAKAVKKTPTKLVKVEPEVNKQQLVLADNIKALNKLFQTKTKLYREKHLATNDTILIKLLGELIEQKYAFTEKQVNLFFELATYTPGYYNGFICSDNVFNRKINEYMLINYNINETQLTIAMEMRQYHRDLNYCYDILFEKGYNFTIKQFALLKNLKYLPPLLNNYDTIHNNLIFAACLHLFYKDNHTKISKDDILKLVQNYDTCLTLLHRNKVGFNIDHLNIITFILPKHSDLDILLEQLFSNCDNTIFNLICNDDYLYSGEILCKILDKFGYDNDFANYLFENTIPGDPEILLKLVIKGYNVTLPILNDLLSSCDLNDFKVININDYEKLNLSEKTLKETYARVDSTIQIPLINLFEIFNIQPDINTLNIACKRSNENDVNLLLNKYKLIPDNNTLNKCIKKLNYNIIHTILSYKITPNEDILLQISSYQIKYSSSDVITIMELLIKFGLIIKIDSVAYLLLNKCCVENLERFDIKYDEHLYFLCYLSNYWPDEYMNKFTINKSVLNMHNLCKNNKLGYDDLMTYMKTNNVLLDRFAIDTLMNENRYLYDVIFIEFECIPSILTAYKRCNIPLGLIAKKYNITADDMFEQYVMGIK